jgi:transcriptional regulator with XRE-family HTH domain
MTIHFPVDGTVSEDRVRPAWPNLATIIARNLKRLRFRARLTQEALAERAGLHKADIERLETGAPDPSISLLWRVAGGLDVPFAALIAGQAARGAVVLRRERSEPIASADGFFTSRPLAPFDEASPTELYEVRVSAGHVHPSEAHASGTSETLVVTKGVLEVTVGREDPYRLEAGDSIVFQADLPHIYANPGTEAAVFHLVVHYRHS